MGRSQSYVNRPSRGKPVTGKAYFKQHFHNGIPDGEKESRSEVRAQKRARYAKEILMSEMDFNIKTGTDLSTINNFVNLLLKMERTSRNLKVYVDTKIPLNFNTIKIFNELPKNLVNLRDFNSFTLRPVHADIIAEDDKITLKTIPVYSISIRRRSRNVRVYIERNVIFASIVKNWEDHLYLTQAHYEVFSLPIIERLDDSQVMEGVKALYRMIRSKVSIKT